MRVLSILFVVAAAAVSVAIGPAPAVAAVPAGNPAEITLTRGGGGGGFHGGGFHGGDFHGGGFHSEHGFPYYDGHNYRFAYRYGFLPNYAAGCPYPTYAYPYCTVPYAGY